MGYVAYWCEHLRDGLQEGARIFNTKAAALECINGLANGFSGKNMTFGLFELGKAIPLSIEQIEEPQPSKVQKCYVEKPC